MLYKGGAIPLSTKLTNTYRGFTLDPFQQEALGYIDENYSVLVSAPTGVGKTLVADYLIEKVHREGGRVVYTAPIKALSNQKFKEFKAIMGEEAVGILTGDVVVNPDASVLIMTTEIFRNLLQESPDRIEDVRYVIFDEIHYIDDPDRGSVWEESLIFMPDKMRFLGLSATIPNVAQLAEWIGETQGNEIKIVTHLKRIVPLKHSLYEQSLGITDVKQLKKKYKRIVSKVRDSYQDRVPATTHTDLINEIKDGYLPCLFFTFSRRKAEVNALELGELHDFLTGEEKEHAREIIDRVVERQPQISSERWSGLLRLLLKGIGYHHAGMLPILKDIVEELFTHRLIKVLYCTETFAVGLNFPCKTVCFDSSTKWDGQAFRAITNREYFQMAGRAGRRGIDAEGFVFTLIDLNYFNPHDLPSMKESQIEPLQSQFALTYNSILNLIKNYDDQQIYKILGQNFATYQAFDEREHLRERIDELKAELDSFCEHIDGEACPVVYDRLLRKQKQYQYRLAKERYPRNQRRMRQQLRVIKKKLADVEKHGCTQQEQHQCKNDSKQYRKLVHRYQSLMKREQQLDPQERYYQEYQDKKSLLLSLGYLDNNGLTSSGEFAGQIHGQELLVTELFMDGWLHKYSVPELNALMVAIGYEPRRNETKLRHKLNFTPVYKTIFQVAKIEERFIGTSSIEFNDHIAILAYRWSNGESFETLMENSMIDEGDLVFAFRRGIDMLRQVRNAASEDQFLRSKLKECITKMDRDQVSIWL